MYCRNCGKEVANEAVVCLSCGCNPRKGEKYCQNCGKETNPNAEICTSCGVRLSYAGTRSWMLALLFSILLGYLGVDRFYMGYIGLGILKLVTGGGCGIWWLIDIVLIATKKLPDIDGNELIDDGSF